MRALFLLLVLANVGFFAYANWLRAPDSSAELIPKLQVNPERIRIMAPSEKVRTGGAPRDALACLEWGLFAGADVARADAAVATLQLPGVMIQRAVADAGGYWVYLPPMRTKAEVDKRVASLKARGVKDFYVVQDAGQWRNAMGTIGHEQSKLLTVIVPNARAQTANIAVIRDAYKARFMQESVLFTAAPLCAGF